MNSAAGDHQACEFVQELFCVGHSNTLDQNHVNVLAERDQLALDTHAELGAVVIGNQVDDKRQRFHDQILDGLADVVVGMREGRQSPEIHIQSCQNLANRHGDSLIVDFNVVKVVLTQERPQVVALGVEEGRRQIFQVTELQLNSEHAESMIHLRLREIVVTIEESRASRRCRRSWLLLLLEDVSCDQWWNMKGGGGLANGVAVQRHSPSLHRTNVYRLSLLVLLLLVCAAVADVVTVAW